MGSDEGGNGIEVLELVLCLSTRDMGQAGRIGDREDVPFRVFPRKTKMTALPMQRNPKSE